MRKEISIVLVVDNDGACGVGSDRDEAVASFKTNVTEDIEDIDGLVFYTLNVSVPLPTPKCISVALPAADGVALVQEKIDEAIS